MRSLLALSLVLLAATASLAQPSCPSSNGYHVGRNYKTMQRPQSLREYIVYVPQSYNSSQPVPLQFLYHGLNDNCDNFLNETGFIPFAEQYGYILVAPCGSIGLLGIAWNSGTCCGFETEQHPNDFAFAKAIVAEVSSNVCIDKRRIFSTGFSNGAFMSEVLGCTEPSIFRAVASVSGIVELRPGNAGGLQACDSNISQFKQRPSVLMIHGDFDFVVPWTGDALLGFPAVPDNVNAWKHRNKCNPVGKQTLNVSTFTNEVFSDCHDGWDSATSAHGTVEIVRNHGGGHEWPSVPGFDTTTYVFNFIRKFW